MGKATGVHYDDGRHGESYFKSIGSSSVIVPEDYDHLTCLTSFRAAHRASLSRLSDDITDDHFSNATTVLSPGQKLGVRIFQIDGTVTSEDCLAQLIRVNATLVGVQGMSLVYEQMRNELPNERGLISFDVKGALWKDNRMDYRVPYLRRDVKGDFEFTLVFFDGDWGHHQCLLAFYEQNSHRF